MRDLVSAIAVALLGVALFLVPDSVLLAIGDWLVVRDDLEPADVIFVLADAEQLIDYAIQLYHEGYGRKILFSAGEFLPNQENRGEHGRARALEQGVPADAIIADHLLVTSTYAEALRLGEILEQMQEPVHSVIVVSETYHARRAQWAVRHVLDGRVRLRMAPVPWEMSPHQRRWWNDPASRSFVESEYGKLAYYYARYGLGWEPLSRWLASFDVA